MSPRLDAMRRGNKCAESYLSRLSFRPDPFQVRAARAIDAGDSVLVAAPTGAGKTLVAECAAHRALERGEFLYYTTPIKALSNQKYRDLRDKYGETSIGLLTGDNSINPSAPVVVMTTEVLRNMIYEDTRRLANLRYVVLDEVHYLQDRYRGATWEEVIIELPANVQLIALSATVGNLPEFAGWLRSARGNVEVIEESARPVPLHNLYALEDRRSDELRVLPIFASEAEDAAVNPSLQRLLKADSRGGRSKSIRSPGRLDIIEELAYEDALPAIYFIFSRAACEDAARQCFAGGLRLTTKNEAREIRRVVEEGVSGIEEADLNALDYGRWSALLESGISTHHAGLIPAFKEIVEELFVRSLVKVVFATETLSLGINMPARAVVIESLSKFNGRFHAILTSGEYTQLSGRAGRRGIDPVGYCVVLHSRWVPFARVAEVAGSRAYELVSSFIPNYNMATNLIATRGRPEAERMLASSFAHYRSERALKALRADLVRREEALRGRQGETKNVASSKRKKALSDREAHMSTQIEKLKRRIKRRELGLVGKFDAILEVLATLGYVDGWELTRKGEILSCIYCERDLLVAESIACQVDEDLDIAELAGLASSFVFEARGGREADARIPTLALERALGRVRKLWKEMARAEEVRGLEPMLEPDFGFVEMAYRWARGEGLHSLVGDDETAGDFVRNAKQVADICRQMVAAGGRQDFEGAASATNRGVVAHSNF